MMRRQLKPVKRHAAAAVQGVLLTACADWASAKPPKRARRHLHFTPTSSTWVNLVERWFKELTERRLRRGAFSSVAALVEAIGIWTEHWNDDPKPFVWHKTAEQIIDKVRRGRAALHQINFAADHEEQNRSLHLEEAAMPPSVTEVSTVVSLARRGSA